jgi:DNA helicase-2/ATP-dependent DNA helicase PcrA
VRVPSAPNENTAYGNAVHGTMRILIENYVSEGLWPSEKELISVFHAQMNKFKGNFTEKQFKSRTQQGEHLIPLILSQKKDVYLKNRYFKTEYSLQSTIGNVPVKGSIDKIAIDGNSVQIYDYKTGNNKKMQSASMLGSRYNPDKLPPNYWFQVGIYGLLIKNKPDLNWEFLSGGIESMSPDDDHSLPVWNNYYTAEHFELIEKWVIEADRKLKNKEFLTGCGENNCFWCNFSKENNLVKHLPEFED